MVAVVAPIVVPLIVPPEMVTLAKLLEPDEVTLPTKLPVTLPVTLPVMLPVMLPVKPPLAETVVNAPDDAVVAPIVVLLIVEAVMVKACKAAEAIKAVPAELTIATLYPLPAKVGNRSNPRVTFSSSLRIVADEPGELGVG